MRRTIEFLMSVDWKSFLGFVCWKPELRNQWGTTIEYVSITTIWIYNNEANDDLFLARTSRKLISRKPKDFVALSISLSVDRDVEWMLRLSMRALVLYTCCIFLWTCSISWDVERDPDVQECPLRMNVPVISYFRCRWCVNLYIVALEPPAIYLPAKRLSSM